MGPLFNLEGRYHFSLVEWFSHWHEDVFGDLEYIDAGSDTLAGRVRARRCSTTRAWAPRSTPSSSARTASRSAGATPWATSSRVDADECILTVPFVLLRHMEISGLDMDKWFTIRNVYYGRAHKIFMQFSRRWWADDYAITHGVTVTDLAIRNVVYTPAGQDPAIAQGRDHRLLRVGAGLHGVLDAGRVLAHHPGARGPGQDPSRGARDASSSASATTGRWTGTAAASGRCSARSR